MASAAQMAILLSAANNTPAMEILRGDNNPADIKGMTSRLAAGDEEAFRTFHQLYFDRLLRYHIVIAHGNEADARDALQDTLLRVARHVRGFETEEAFWCWLTVLCRTSATDGYRKRSRYWRLLADYARSLFQRHPAESHQADGSERLQQLLQESVSELDGGDRCLVEGKYIRCVSVRDLAAETGLTEKAVESRLLRARRELRATILEKLKYEKTI